MSTSQLTFAQWMKQQEVLERYSPYYPGADFYAVEVAEDGVRIKVEEVEVDWNSLPMFVSSPAILEKSKQGSSVSGKGPLKTFTCFSKLPFELQLMVWEAARPAPRVIKPLRSKHGLSYYSPAPIPAMLHTCRISRMVASKWYQLQIDATLVDGPRIFFDSERDFYYTDNKGYNNPRGIFDTEKIHNIAVETRTCPYPVDFRVELWLGQIKQFMVVDVEKKMDGVWGEVADFHADSTPFAWQGSKSLAEIRAEKLKNNLCGFVVCTEVKIWKAGYIPKERDLSVEKGQE